MLPYQAGPMSSPYGRPTTAPPLQMPDAGGGVMATPGITAFQGAPANPGKVFSGLMPKPGQGRPAQKGRPFGRRAGGGQAPARPVARPGNDMQLHSGSGGMNRTF